MTTGAAGGSSDKASPAADGINHRSNNSHQQANGRNASEQQPGNQTRKQQQNGTGKFVAGPTSVQDVVLGMLTQVARKYLFLVDPRKKALFYLTLVAVLSLISLVVDLPDNYFTQKDNVFNKYITKMGWMWTLVLLCPFTWLTSLLHHESKLKAGFDLFRLLIATAFWYIWTSSFVKVEHHTGRCHGSVSSARSNCYDAGGKWIPGFDISGHAFLLLYSILIICEEVTSFQNWPSKPRVSVQHIPSRKDFVEFQKKTKFIQWIFVLLFALHLFWDTQIFITSLYYHEFWQKLIGALFAVFSWFVTYRLWFIVGFPFLPIRRHIKSF